MFSVTGVYLSMHRVKGRGKHCETPVTGQPSFTGLTNKQANSHREVVVFLWCSLPELHDWGLAEETGAHLEAEEKRDNHKSGTAVQNRTKNDKRKIKKKNVQWLEQLLLCCLPPSLYLACLSPPHSLCALIFCLLALPRPFSSRCKWLTIPTYWTPDLWQHFGSRSIHNYKQFNYLFALWMRWVFFFFSFFDKRNQWAYFMCRGNRGTFKSNYDHGYEGW